MAKLSPQSRLQSKLSGELRGWASLPGDKSISHRALILGTMARGTTRITGLLEGADVMATKSALTRLGAQITRDPASGAWCVEGMGLGSFIAPHEPLDLGNAGTGVRLLMGAVAGGGISAVFTGDASLSVRPMGRVSAPLTAMGAEITARDGGFLPLTVKGAAVPRAISWHSPHASAQVKSAILLAGLTARGQTSVIEPYASRDHTESMLRHFGVTVTSTPLEGGGMRVAVGGEADLSAADIVVPADPSSAAFLMVAGLITEGSDITLGGVGMNPLRCGLFETLIDMGAAIDVFNQRIEGGEAVADIRVQSSRLKGVDVPPGRAVRMIDEYPILSVAASCAEGRTTMTGIGELRVKETDRIALMATGLRRLGVHVDDDADSMAIEGKAYASGGGGISDKMYTSGGAGFDGGIVIDACHDHRIAMAFLTMGLVTRAGITVTGAETIATSFPGFVEVMEGIGADIGAT